MSSLTLRIGERRVGRFSGLTASNVDPGGLEVLSCQVPDLIGIRPGDRVELFLGLECVWAGIVNEPTDDADEGRDQYAINALGLGECLKRNKTRQIFLDRDVNKWRGSSVQRQLNVISLLSGSPSLDVEPDSTTGAPSLKTSLQAPWSASTISEAWYDAGGLALAKIYYAWKQGPAGVAIGAGDANGHWRAVLTDDDVASAYDISAELRAAGPGSGTLAATTGSRDWALVQFYYDIAFSGDNYARVMYWTCLAVYGNQGLPTRSAGDASLPPGLWPSDIAKWVMMSCPEVAERINPVGVRDSSGYVTTQAAYTDPVNPEDIVADQAKLLGWHWGIWEPASFEDDRPTGYFCPVPSSATAIADAKRCQQLKIPKLRLDALYTSARVKYADAAGSVFYATATINNPYLDDVSIERCLDLDMGLGTATSAATYGTFALKLAIAAARGAGSCLLPTMISDPNGGQRPSATLKSGRDRIRLRNLPDGAINQLDEDTRRFDTFHVRRVELRQDDHTGQVQTYVEFDGGGDLMETITARLQIAQTLIG